MKTMPIGTSDFKKIIMGNFYYVDKSLFIQELLTRKTGVTLIPRPRRFGKTLNISMLQYFFEQTAEQHASLFEHLAISKSPTCMAHQGRYPVIFLTLKDVTCSTWQNCYDTLKKIVTDEFNRHQYLVGSALLSEQEKRAIQTMLDGTALPVSYVTALTNLSYYLSKHYQSNVIILIDEYDTPIHASFAHGYYNECIEFMRGLLSGGLKDNKHLELAVITGILRISKESIFSGLNNMQVCSVLDDEYADIFGYTQQEVADALHHYGLGDSLNAIRNWYNGYSIGDRQKIYNPWSINNAIARKGLLRPYWVNTSENQLIMSTMRHADSRVKESFERLLNGESITVPIQPDTTFVSLTTNPDAVWGFLLLSGYLTFDAIGIIDRVFKASLRIPNEELMMLYETIIRQWFIEQKKTAAGDYESLVVDLEQANIASFKLRLQTVAHESFSYFDVTPETPERFYHAFILGLLVSLKKSYTVRSNRESGLGRYDVILFPQEPTRPGFIFEFKKAENNSQQKLTEASQDALRQIRDKKYASELRAHGVAQIIALGIACSGKDLLVQEELLA